MATKETKTKTPGFLRRMFMDENDINEKSIVGFGSFIMMVITLLVDLGTGITLGAFGIASVDKFITTKHGKKKESTAEGDY